VKGNIFMFIYNDKHIDVYLLQLIKLAVSLAIFVGLFGCESTGELPSPTISNSDVQISTMPYLTETPVPACVSIPDVKLNVQILSDNAVQIEIAGLQPNEPVYTIFSSESQGKVRRIECCEKETANGNGNYQYTQVLRGENIDVEFKDWQVQVIHSGSAACTNFKLP
jgi:hypothetical protein